MRITSELSILSIVQKVKHKDKPRNNGRQQSFQQALKKKRGNEVDKLSRLLILLAVITGTGVVVSQICIAEGWIHGPIYFSTVVNGLSHSF